MTTYERYAPYIQDFIYKEGWQELRQVQVETCESILDREHHVLISSGTASGKTEAAFFPILSDLYRNPSKTVGILYIGPLKALINDQFSRLEGLLEEEGIPVFAWHGDVSQTQKKKAVQQARGVLQITPESLEAMLMTRAGEAVRLFSDLKYVVIDEIHAFMGMDRGLQVICQLVRLERLTKCKPRRVGLSATLHDVQPALDFLCWGSERKGEVISVESNKRRIQLATESYFIPEDSQEAEEGWNRYYQSIYENTHKNKCLIFTNSRGDAEKTIANLKDIAEQRKERDIFHIHHGSVSASLRQEAESALRKNTGPTVAAATLTLEMGIDIGDLDFTLQLGAPYTCSSFVQRLGRSGRRSSVSKMLFYDVFEEKNKDVFDQIPWNLLRTIAIIQLYVEEHWVEPFLVKEKPYSLLVHQTLSTLMTFGELSPADLARRVLTLPIFQGKITKEEYKTILHHLIFMEMLEQMENGGIIVGLKGERFTNHFTFYAVFSDEETYRVRGKEGDIGTLDTCPMVEEVFVLAGRTWQVSAIDQEKKVIFVVLSKNRRVPSWRGTSAQIHTKIVQRMKKVLLEEKQYPYLRESSQESLQKARDYCDKTGILEKNYVEYGQNSFYFCPWVGTKELFTTKQLLQVGLKETLEVQSVTGGLHYLQITANTAPEQWVDRLRNFNGNCNDPDLVLPGNICPKVDKYDNFIPEQFLRYSYLKNHMDVPTALALLLSEF